MEWNCEISEIQGCVIPLASLRDSTFWLAITIIGSILLLILTILLHYIATTYQMDIFSGPLPGALSVLFGIVLGLSVNQTLKAKRDESRARAIEILLKEDEIQRMHTLVSAKKCNFLETQTWQSLIQSGDVAILKMSLQRILFEFYAKVNVHNIETKELRQVAIEANKPMSISDERHRAAQNQHRGLSIRVLEKEKKLKEKIEEIIGSDEWSV